MAKFLDLTGKRFGRLTVIGVDKKVKSGKRERYYWKCKCDCGNIKSVRTDCLTSGNVNSCGCLKKEQDRINLTKNHRHKLSKTHLWDVYYGMRSRCNNPEDKRYFDYGGRGIKICEEWSESIDNFAKWAYANGYDENNKDLQIDRIDNNGNYEPSNCRWVSRSRNCRNRRSNRMVKQEDGTYITIADLADKLGLDYDTVYNKYKKVSIRRSELETSQLRANPLDSERLMDSVERRD